MAIFTVGGAQICGLAAAVPREIEQNLDYDEFSEAEKDMFIKTVGISSRHIARAGLTAADLCAEAAAGLLSTLNWSKSEVDLLVFVTQSPDHLLPASAVMLQHQLGLPVTTVAFDINLGCSGYVYGLSLVYSMLATGGFKKAILLAGDISSAAANRKDKSTWPIFGDAGTATAIEYDPSAKAVFNLQSDGSGANAIIIPDGGLRHPINDQTYINVEVEKGVIRNRRNLWINGLDVFNFSVRKIPSNINTLLQSAGLEIGNIDYFVLHQANRLILETIRKKLKLPAEKVPYSLSDFGNTSSASIPVTIVSQLAIEAKAAQKWVFSGFGVGLSWGSVYLETKSIQCLPIILC